MVNGDEVLNVDSYTSAFNTQPTALSIENDTYRQAQLDVSLSSELWDITLSMLNNMKFL